MFSQWYEKILSEENNKKHKKYDKKAYEELQEVKRKLHVKKAKEQISSYDELKRKSSEKYVSYDEVAELEKEDTTDMDLELQKKLGVIEYDADDTPMTEEMKIKLKEQEERNAEREMQRKAETQRVKDLIMSYDQKKTDCLMFEFDKEEDDDIDGDMELAFWEKLGLDTNDEKFDNARSRRPTL